MCLIIHAKPEFNISEKLMENFSKRNDDGFGVMWIEDNKIHAQKFGPTEMDRLYPVYQSLQNKEHFIHLRMRTHGTVDAAMAHPYYCGYGIWLMHNGVLPVNGTDESKSDTWHFINDVLTPLFKVTHNPHELIRSKVFDRIMHQYLGYSNRIVIGDRGGYVLFNTKQWHTIDKEETGVKGMLVSNQYAWDANSFGRKSHYGYKGKVYRGGKWIDADEDPDQADLWGGHGSSANDAATQASAHNTEAGFQERIRLTFFCLGRHWYINCFGMVFKRKMYGFTRRSDLDDSEQFWNSFPGEKLMEAGMWMAEANNIDEEVAKDFAVGQTEIQTPASVGAGAQYVIKWDNLPKEVLEGVVAGAEAQAADEAAAKERRRQPLVVVTNNNTTLQ